jgi:hypothetical protein
MLTKYAESIADNGSIIWVESLQCTDLNSNFFQKEASEFPLKRVAIVKEGASDAIALLGMPYYFSGDIFFTFCSSSLNGF